MQIQLKQSEIEAALKLYVKCQGINLVGKDVTVSFTAGRKGTGITADLDIQEGENALTDVRTDSIPEGVVGTDVKGTDVPETQAEAETEADTPPFATDVKDDVKDDTEDDTVDDGSDNAVEDDAPARKSARLFG